MRWLRVPKSCHNAQVLVLAPRFPSINQPWMDTYLEQLLRHDIPFCVVSTLRSNGRYHEKVDRLGLRRFVVSLPSAPVELVAAALWSLLRYPIRSLSVVATAWKQRPTAKSGRRLWGRLFRALSTVPLFAVLPRLEVVHSHNDFMGLRFLPAARRFGVPMVVTFHGLEPRGVDQMDPAQRRTLGEYASQVLVNTKFARAHAAEVGFPPDRIQVLPQGLPIEDFPYSPASPLGPNEPLRVLSVGRFHRDKGQAYSLLALSRLLRSGHDVVWHFVGVGPDKSRLMGLSSRLGLTEHAHFHEGIAAHKLLELYHASHLLVLASVSHPGNREHTETQGVVLQEAQAAGCIPIATRVGGIPECVHHGRDGLLVEDRSHRALAEAIEYMFEHRDKWPSFQAQGRRNVEERFSADAVGARMAEILRGTGSQRAPARRTDRATHDQITGG